MAERTLNLGILAHIDAGKTSLTERLLFDNGVIAQLGSVDSGDTQTDKGDLERERGITIRCAVAAFPLDELQVNLVDTPGHPDFIAEVERALSVLDGAVLVVSAVEGVQAQTRVLMKSLRRMGLPTLIFVNKIDRMGARYDSLLAEIRRKLVPRVVPMNSVRALGTPDAATAPTNEWEFHNRTAEILADHDDVLLARLVDGSVPARAELDPLIARQTAAGVLHPVFFGSALTGQGIGELTNGIAAFLPPTVNGAAGGARAGETAADDATAAGTVFAVERGMGGEKIAYLRLFAGELRERQRVVFHRPGSGGGTSTHAGRITGLERVGPTAAAANSPSTSADGRTGRGRPGADRRRLTAGDIGRLRGLAQIRVGDRLGERDVAAGQPHFSPPSLETVVRARQPGQGARLHAALTSLADEDPLIRTRTGSDGATSVLLYGAVQQEVIEARLRREFGVEAVFEPVRPVYLERPVRAGESTSEIDRHGPNLFWATIGLRVEPGAIGSGVSYVRGVEPGLVSRAFHRAIEETSRRTLQQGLHGWEVTDCVVTLYRVGFAAPLSTAGDFRNLTPLVLMRALENAGTRVFEPCHSLEVEVPGDALSGVLGFLSSLGGDITESVEQGASWLITGGLPARLVQEFTMALPGLTGGEGAVWSHPGTDRPVRGAAPERERSDGNPLNYEEYLRFLANRSLTSSATAPG